MDHIRIDEGIRRGPKKRRKVPRQQDPRTGRMLQIIPPDLDPQVVLNRYLTDETTSQIAQSFGVTRKALTGWLRSALPKEWKQVQIVRALVRKDDGNDGLEDAPDALSLARAREMIRSAQFDLEHLDEDFRPKQETTTNIQPVFIVNVAAPAHIEAKPDSLPESRLIEAPAPP